MKELLEVSALEYINVGISIQEISENLAAHVAPDEPLDREAFAHVTASLSKIIDCCKQLNLTTSVNFLEHFIEAYKKETPTYTQIRQDIQYFRMAFNAELGQRRVFFVPPERAGYYSANWLARGEKIEPLQPVFDAFPSTEDEFVEAGNCLAFERPTATVFHLMRALEVGLKAVAKALGVAYISEWGRCIGDMEKVQPKSPFFTEAIAHLRSVKNAWRNPTMHIERRYSDREAETIFGAVQAFMLHLATKLAE
jgi:hypothetical protein